MSRFNLTAICLELSFPLYFASKWLQASTPYKEELFICANTCSEAVFILTLLSDNLLIIYFPISSKSFWCSPGLLIAWLPLFILRVSKNTLSDWRDTWKFTCLELYFTTVIKHFIRLASFCLVWILSWIVVKESKLCCQWAEKNFFTVSWSKCSCNTVASLMYLPSTYSAGGGGFGFSSAPSSGSVFMCPGRRVGMTL